MYPGTSKSHQSIHYFIDDNDKTDDQLESNILKPWWVGLNIVFLKVSFEKEKNSNSQDNCVIHKFINWLKVLSYKQYNVKQIQWE